MDNLICNVLAAAVFIAFVGGLADSIGVLPFALIVFFVVGLMGVDFVQSAKAGLESVKANRK